MVELNILNPVADVKAAENITSAPKVNDLNGKRIGLFWNQKPGGDVILRITAELLNQKFRGINFINLSGERSTHVTNAQIEAVVKNRCDAVIASTAD